ncbi:MAG: hypothetical protein QOK49_4514 [Baekduia sp.]|nr:hypothetical protein [Baekduia sp.]
MRVLRRDITPKTSHAKTPVFAAGLRGFATSSPLAR